MIITSEQIEKRKAEALAGREQHLANANLAQGVVIDCDHWLSVLDKKDEPKTD